jgi:hypothetical protein
MCCLKYEQENYEQTRKKMPKVGKEVMTPDGPGVVWDLNIIKETVKVRIQKGDSSELKEYPMEDVQRPGAVNVRKEEPAPAAVAEAPAGEVRESAEAQQPRARKERPAREERKPRREGGEKADQPERQEKRRPQQDKPAEAPVEEAPAKEPKAAPAAEAETAGVNSWRAALEKAMREAGNNGNT